MRGNGLLHRRGSIGQWLRLRRRRELFGSGNGRRRYGLTLFNRRGEIPALCGLRLPGHVLVTNDNIVF